MSTCPACGRTISVDGQLDHWRTHLIVAPGEGHAGGHTWRCSCGESHRFTEPDEAGALASLAIHMGLVHGVAPDQPMELWLKEHGVTPDYSPGPAQAGVPEEGSPLRRSVLEQLEAFRVATRTPIAVIALEFRALEASEEWRARETNTCPLAFFAIYDPDAGPEAAGSGAAVGKMKARADTVLLVTDDALLVAWSLPKVFGKIIHHVEVVPFDAIRAVNAVSVGVGLGFKDPGFEVLADCRYVFQLYPRGVATACVTWRDRAVATIRERIGDLPTSDVDGREEDARTKAREGDGTDAAGPSVRRAPIGFSVDRQIALAMAGLSIPSAPPSGELPVETDPGSAAGNTPVTKIQSERWTGRAVVLRSDGTAGALLDVIATAVAKAGYPITQRSYSDMTLRFESGGVTWNSFAGDVTTVVVTQGPDAVRATFTSLGKPFGLTRAQRVKATKWVTRLIPAFGDLWSGPPFA
jgi:hypothetical protein